MNENVNTHVIDDADYQLLQMTKSQILDDDFWYVFPDFFNIATLGGQQTQAIQFQADSFFRIERISCFFANATTANAATQFTSGTRPIPNARIVFTDSGSGRQLMNSSIPIASLCGYEGLPYLLPVPKIMNPSATLTATITNFDGTVAASLYVISLGGRKLYNVK